MSVQAEPANDGRPGQSTKHSTQRDHVRGLASGHWDGWWAAVLTWSAASQDVKAGQVWAFSQAQKYKVKSVAGLTQVRPL